MRKGASGIAGEVDRYVGYRLRERRILAGLTQQQLAARIGITYQQLHKYECSINRMSASRLYAAAEALGVPIAFFYEGFEADTPRTALKRERRTLEVSRAFSEIEEPRFQAALMEMARVLSGIPERREPPFHKPLPNDKERSRSELRAVKSSE
jgi:transcriptional regulator with XRE-family HTH domain